MPPTRRTLLGAAGATLSLLAGCSSPGSPAGTSSPTPDPAVAVRLDGPDANRTLFDPEAVLELDPIRETGDAYVLAVTLSDDGASRVADRFRSAGVGERPMRFDVVVLADGRVLSRSDVAPGLASAAVEGDWDGVFRVGFGRRSDARAAQEALACGAKTAPVPCGGE